MVNVQVVKKNAGEQKKIQAAGINTLSSTFLSRKVLEATHQPVPDLEWLERRKEELGFDGQRRAAFIMLCHAQLASRVSPFTQEADAPVNPTKPGTSISDKREEKFHHEQ